MVKENLPKFGLGLCILGLAVAFLSIVPAVVPSGSFPWPVFVGSVIYFPGAMMAFMLSHGKDRNKRFNQLRFIRLGFIAVMVLVMNAIMKG
ncbi:MAG: hypothetical protein ACKVQS_08800 [Fimbriimonadaceae bacterium]